MPRSLVGWRLSQVKAWISRNLEEDCGYQERILFCLVDPK